MDADEERIHGILGDDNARTMHNAARYREYLLKHIPLPIVVTGTEDFPWEEPYVFGGRTGCNYRRRKTLPKDALPVRSPTIGALMLPELLASFGDLDYDIVEMVLAGQEGWDRYEAAKWHTMRRWLEANPDDDFAKDVRAKQRRTLNRLLFPGAVQR